MSEFNKYGNPTKNGLLEKNSIDRFNTAVELFNEMFKQGASVVEVRAAGFILMQELACAVSDAVLEYNHNESISV